MYFHSHIPCDERSENISILQVHRDRITCIFLFCVYLCIKSYKTLSRTFLSELKTWKKKSPAWPCVFLSVISLGQVVVCLPPYPEYPVYSAIERGGLCNLAFEYTVACRLGSSPRADQRHEDKMVQRCRQITGEGTVSPRRLYGVLHYGWGN